jgi:Fe-S cluster assembly protein SufD
MIASALSNTPPADRDTPEWLRARRAAAEAALAEHGFPTRRDERWKYTRADAMAAFAEESLTRIGSVSPGDRTRALELAGREAATLEATHRIVFVNGVHQPGSGTALPDGVELVPAGYRPESVTAPTPATRSMALQLLNTARPSDEFMLDVAAGVTVESALHLLFVQAGERAFAQPRLSVRLGPGASLTLIEHYLAADDGESMTNAAADIQLEEGASLQLIRLQAQNAAALHMTSVDATLAAKASLMTWTVDTGGHIVRNDLNARLVGEGAHVDMFGLYLGSGRQHIDNHTVAEHIARDTSSTEDYRGILRDRCRCVFNGKVIVHAGADGTDAAQSNPNLLLSDHAEIDTKPELEIYADEVKCSHGATVGQIDPTSLFYLRSRGIDEHTATQLLTYAFCRERLGRIGDDRVRARAEHMIASEIPDFTILEEQA